jgi:hypothetical protein
MMPKLIPRVDLKPFAEAATAGDKLYLGRQCEKVGHGAVRYTASRQCVDCCTARDKQRRVRLKAEYTQPDGFTRRVFVLGDPQRMMSDAGNGR